MKLETFAYRSADKVIDKDLQLDTIRNIEALQFEVHKNCSKGLRSALLEALTKCGWSDEIIVAAGSQLSITSMNGRTGLCLQTGNMARFYADVLKLQALFVNERIEAAFYIVPSLQCARIMGDNIANYHRFVREITSVFEDVITIPMIIIGLE